MKWSMIPFSIPSFVKKHKCIDLHGRFLMKKKMYSKALQDYDAAKELAESYNDKNLLKGILEKTMQAL